MLQTRCAL